MKEYKTIDEYIKSFPVNIQTQLKTIRNLIKEIAPKSEEKISYGIPTFKLNGKNLVHFGGFKTHIGFFPGSEAVEVFADKLAKYETSKGTIRFPLNEEIPATLVKQITKFRIQKIPHSKTK